MYYLDCQVISFLCGASPALYSLKASEDKVHLALSQQCSGPKNYTVTSEGVLLLSYRGLF